MKINKFETNKNNLTKVAPLMPSVCYVHQYKIKVL